MKLLFSLVFTILFVLTPSVSSAYDGAFLVPAWTNPLPTAVYAFGTNVVVTGSWQLPADWIGKIYVYQDALLGADDSLLTQGTQKTDVGGNTGYAMDNTGGTTTKSGTFSFDIGAQLSGLHNIHLEFWGGEVCAINKALNDLNGTNFTPSCPITADNAAFNIVWPARKYTVGNPLFPSMTVTPSSDPALNFLNVEYGSPQTLTFTIGNTGGQTLSGSISGIMSPFSCSPSCNYAVNPSTSQNITIQYVPPPAPNSSDQTFVFSCAGASLACQKVSASLPVVIVAQPSESRHVIANSVTNSVSPNIIVTPSLMNYGTLNLGVPVADRSFVVKNTGGGYLNGTMTFSAPEYSCTGSCSYSIPAGGQTTIWVHYVPSVAGTFNDTATFGGGLGQVVTLSSVVNDKPIIAVGTTLLDFFSGNGNQPVNVGSCKSLSTWVQNIGASTLSGSVTNIPIATPPLNDPTVNPLFTCTMGCTYNNLTYGQWQWLTIQYCPTVNGTETGTAMLTNALNAPNTATINLTGRGNTQPIGSISSSLIFGNVLINTTKQITFTITNTGVGVLSGTVGALPSQFACDSGCTYNVPAGGSVSVTLSFNPLLVQTYSGTVNFPGIGNYSVSGSGVQPIFQASWGDWPYYHANMCPGATCLDPEIKDYDIGTTTFTGNLNLAIQYKTFYLYAMNKGSGANITYSFPNTAHFKCVAVYYTGTVDAGGCSGTLLPFLSGSYPYLVRPTYQFQPDAAGDFSEPLVITYDYGFGPQTKTVNLVGHSISAPFLDVSPTGLLTIVPNTPVGTTPSPKAVYTVTNLGVGPMDYTVTGIPVGSPFSCITNCSMVGLMPNIPVTVEFEFTPTDALTTIISPWFNSTGGNLQRSTRGTGSVSPVTELVPLSIFYPDTNMGQFTNRTVRVKNSGLGTLSGVVTPVAPSGLDFFCIANCGYSLTAGQSTDSASDPVIQFRPMHTGSLNAMIDFSGGSNGVQSVSVFGTAIFAPIIDIRGADTNFGTVVITKYKDRVFTVKNSGTSDLGSGTFTVTGPFSCIAPVDPIDGLCHYSLNGGTEVTITIRFSPTTIGPANGVVSLSGVPIARFFVNGQGGQPIFIIKEI